MPHCLTKCLFLLSLCLASGSIAGWAQMEEGAFITWDDFVTEYVDEQRTEEAEKLTEEEVEQLEERASNPWQINRVGRNELLSLPFLDEAQADSLLSYRDRKHGMVSLGELQLVWGMDYFTRRYLSLFVRCDSTLLPSEAQLKAWGERHRIGYLLSHGSHEIETRLDVPLYRRKGYEMPEKPTRTNYYVGNSLHHVVRYRYNCKREATYGLTFEKDAGEPVGKRGFYPYDYISGYVALRPKGKMWSIVVGDFNVRSSHGLLFGKNIFGGRTQTLNAVMRPVFSVKEHTSTDETDFFRGGAITLQKGAWNAAVFASYRRLDARMEGDTAQTLLSTGLHRTLSEIDYRRTLGSVSGGWHLMFHRSAFALGLDGYLTHYDREVYPPQRYYNHYYFRGQTAFGTSLTYLVSLKKFSISGETAFDQHFHLATTHTAAYSPFRRLSLRLQGRAFSPRFVSVYGQTLSQGSRVSNEQGLLFSVRYLPIQSCEISAYVDLYRFPAPTFASVRSNSKGMEVQVQTLYHLPPRWQLQLQYRAKSKQYSITDYQLLEYRNVHRLRASATYARERVGATLQADASFAHRQSGRRSFGWMLSARGTWKPTSRLQTKALLALFFTDDYDTRLYAYEPQLYRMFAFSSYSKHGLRGVWTLSYKVWKKLDVSFRFGSTKYFNRKSISSRLDLISSSWKNDLSFQLRWKI